MVKLFFLGVFKKSGEDAILLKHSVDLSTFGFFQKSSADDFLKFTSKMVVSRTEVGTKVSIREKTYFCHAFVRVDNTAAVVVSDEDYPAKVAHTINLKILEEFPQCNLDEFLKRFQDPKEADSMMRLQADLDETKIILHSTIANLLRRGEKLDDLVAKSEDLSSQSKIFYKTARKTTRCCELF